MPIKRPSLSSRPPSPRDLANRLYEVRIPLGLGALALLLVVSGWWGYRVWQMKQEGAAQALMTKALVMLAEASKAPDGAKAAAVAPGHLEQALQLFREIRKEYPSSRAAEEALLQIGNILYRQGEHQGALQAYQEYLERYPTGRLVVLAGLGKAYSLEAQRRYQEAAATFRTLSERYKHDPLAVEALMGLARCLKDLDRPSDAVEIYRRVAKEYPGTAWASQAEEWLASADRGGR
jgi:TolA-binding protein